MKEMKGVQVLQDNDFDDQVCFLYLNEFVISIFEFIPLCDRV